MQRLFHLAFQPAERTADKHRLLRDQRIQRPKLDPHQNGWHTPRVNRFAPVNISSKKELLPPFWLLPVLAFLIWSMPCRATVFDWDAAYGTWTAGAPAPGSTATQ